MDCQGIVVLEFPGYLRKLHPRVGAENPVALAPGLKIEQLQGARNHINYPLIVSHLAKLYPRTPSSACYRDIIGSGTEGFQDIFELSSFHNVTRS